MLRTGDKSSELCKYLKPHLAQLIDLDTSLKLVNETSDNIGFIESSLLVFLDSESISDLDEMTLNEVRNVLESIKGKRDESLNDKSKLEELKSKLNDKGFYEHDFAEAKKNVEEALAKFEFKYENVAK